MYGPSWVVVPKVLSAALVQEIVLWILPRLSVAVTPLALKVALVRDIVLHILPVPFLVLIQRFAEGMAAATALRILRIIEISRMFWEVLGNIELLKFFAQIVRIILLDSVL